MTTIKGYLIECEGRSLFMRDKEDVLWAVADENYQVTALVAEKPTEVYDQFIVDGPKEEAPNLPSTDDTQERIQLMEELFQLQETDITLLKAQLEKFVEVVEGIVELTEVVSHSSIECRSKLIVIGDSCKALLKPSE